MHVEVEDPDADGVGNLVVTNTIKRRFPVLRYRNGDRGRLVTVDGHLHVELAGRGSYTFRIDHRSMSEADFAPVVEGAAAYQIQLSLNAERRTRGRRAARGGDGRGDRRPRPPATGAHRRARRWTDSTAMCAASTSASSSPARPPTRPRSSSTTARTRGCDVPRRARPLHDRAGPLDGRAPASAPGGPGGLEPGTRRSTGGCGSSSSGSSSSSVPASSPSRSRPPCVTYRRSCTTGPGCSASLVRRSGDRPVVVELLRFPVSWPGSCWPSSASAAGSRSWSPGSALPDDRRLPGWHRQRSCLVPGDLRDHRPRPDPPSDRLVPRRRARPPLAEHSSRHGVPTAAPSGAS